MQAAIGIAAEITIICYLASLDNLLDVIMKFFSMAAITKFDDIYVASLPEEKFTSVAGKHLPVEYKRYMGSLYLNDAELEEEKDMFKPVDL